MYLSRWPYARMRLIGMLILLATLLLTHSSSAAPSSATIAYLPLLVNGDPLSQPDTITYWGMNLYLSKRERLAKNDNLELLATTASAAHVQWTREELPWDLIEPTDDAFQTLYDDSLGLAARSGFGIVGMLLTTPSWARDAACRSNFWCPPANVNEFAEFAAWMVERYDGDGADDAPGSPRVAAWQIWNEPNDTALWPDIGSDQHARKRRYGELMLATYSAIKAADSTATVLTGGTYIYDGSCAGGICDGFNFFNAAGGVFQQVPTARQSFDVFAIHPYIPTDRPDAPQIPGSITVEGRIRTGRSWLNDAAIGRSDAPIWITEIGWCTTSGRCPGDVAVSEDQQANYLVRALVIAQHAGVQHTSWFQFEDAFDDANRIWGNAAIVRTYTGSAYPAKPAYNAYRTLAEHLQSAVPNGTGPLHTHAYNPSAPEGSNVTYDYRYTGSGTTIDVLWRPTDSRQASFPVTSGLSVTLIDRDGAQTPLTPTDGTVQVTISERPILLVQK